MLPCLPMDHPFCVNLLLEKNISIKCQILQEANVSDIQSFQEKDSIFCHFTCNSYQTLIINKSSAKKVGLRAKSVSMNIIVAVK